MVMSRRVEKMISRIEDLKLEDSSKYGSKAVSLGVMLRNGIVVPEGFVLSIQVYEEFLSHNRFPYNETDYLRWNEQIQAYIINGEFTVPIKSEISRYLEDISKAYNNSYMRFAVRSSAMCEDNKSNSMAGMFDSYVNVRDFDEVYNSIKKCYASMFSDKVLSYMVNSGLDMDDMKMGIIVQVFIQGDISGVIFTADSIDMNSDTICINAVNGICENFVSGESPSSLYKIDKFTGKEKTKQVSEGSPELSIKQIKKLSNISLGIESMFNCYQDIEWTIREDDIYILQSRPVTTFKNRDFNIKWTDPEDADFHWWLGPPIPFPPLVLDICPLEEAAFSLGAYNTGYAERFMARNFQNGYIYFRTKDMPNHEIKRKKFLDEVDHMFESGKNIFQDNILPQLKALIDSLNNFLDKELSDKEILEFIDLSLEYFKLSTASHWPAEAGTRYTESFKKYCDNIVGSMNYIDYCDLIYKRSIVTKERELLMQMVSIVKSDKDLSNLFDSCQYDEIIWLRLEKYPKGRELTLKVHEYLDDFGLCDAGYEGFIRSVLLERPDGVLRKIRSLLDVNVNSFRDSIYNMEDRKRYLITTIVNGLNQYEKEDFMKKLAVAEKAFLVADEHNYYIERMSWGYIRLAIMRAAKTLRDVGLISQINDIFFLSVNEIKDSLLKCKIDKKELQLRKELYEKQKHTIAPKDIGNFPNADVNTSIAPFDNSMSEVTEVLKGVSTFEGKIRGRVIVGIPHKVDEDSIIVVYHGHASDITHILNKVKGLIFENGSPFDHLGIISREMNIPAIYYVKGALSLLKTGDMIEINGTDGEVTINL
jgi:phosphohistidine swiveling domain-containing protein